MKKKITYPLPSSMAPDLLRQNPVVIRPRRQSPPPGVTQAEVEQTAKLFRLYAEAKQKGKIKKDKIAGLDEAMRAISQITAVPLEIADYKPSKLTRRQEELIKVEAEANAMRFPEPPFVLVVQNKSKGKISTGRVYRVMMAHGDFRDRRTLGSDFTFSHQESEADDWHASGIYAETIGALYAKIYSFERDQGNTGRFWLGQRGDAAGVLRGDMDHTTWLHNQDQPHPTKKQPLQKGGPSPRVAGQFTAYDVPIKAIKTNPNRFQPRGKAFSEASAARVAANKHPELMEPVWLWRDEQGQAWMLAGHSRFEGYRRRGEQSIPARFFGGDEQAAIAFAMTENDKGTSLSNIERAKYLRSYRECCALTKADEEAEARRLYKKDATTVHALSHLSPGGKAAQTITQFQAVSTGEGKDAETMGVWIGKVRSRYRALTDKHENELFDFLKDNFKTKGRKITSFDAFRAFADEVVARASFIGAFDASRPLNIQGHAPTKSRQQQEIDIQVSAAQKDLNDAVKARDKAVQRIVEKRARGDIVTRDQQSRALKPLEDAVEAAQRHLVTTLQEADRARSSVAQAEQSLFDVPPKADAPPAKGSESPGRDVPERINPTDFNFNRLAYLGSVDGLVVERGKKAKGFLMFGNRRGTLLLAPRRLVRSQPTRHRSGEKLFKDWHSFDPSSKRFAIALPESPARPIGEPRRIYYRSDKIMEAGDEKGEKNAYVHDFHKGRTLFQQGQVYLFHDQIINERGLIN